MKYSLLFSTTVVLASFTFTDVVQAQSDGLPNDLPYSQGDGSNEKPRGEEVRILDPMWDDLADDYRIIRLTNGVYVKYYPYEGHLINRYNEYLE